MIHSRRIRWVAVFTAALAAAGVLHGQKLDVESGRAATPPPKEEGGVSIEVAKKEFDAVKSLRDFGADSKGGLPRLAVPALQGAGPAGPTAPSAPKRPELESRSSKNWLVDAMEKRPSERSGRAEKEGEREDKRDADESRAGRNRGREDAEERNKRSEVPNPFTRYLGDWMTPQDLALLKPALEGPLRNDSSIGDRSFSSVPGDGSVALGESGSKPLLSGVNGPNRQLQAGQVRENPYLEILEGPVGRAVSAPSSVVTPRPSSPAAPPQIQSNMASIPVETPPPRPGRTPDFVRPNTDEKYFKQLKRF